MSSNQGESLEERLEKRRQVRNRRFLKKNSVEESNVSLVNQSPTTQSLDRQSSKRINARPTDTQKSSSSTTVKSSELPPIEKFYSKQTPVLQPITRRQSLYSEDDHQMPLESLPTEDSHFHDNKKSMVTKESLTTTTTLPPTTSLEKAIAIPEPPTSILPPTTFETRGYSTPNRLPNFEQHPSRHPQSTTGRQQHHFNDPIVPPKPSTRTISEQIVSVANYKHQPINPILGKQNSLALRYLFNKRLIHAELSHTTSVDSKQSQEKTVWD